MSRFGAAVLAPWLLVAPPTAQTQDSVPFADAATAALVARARERHEHQDSLVRDYQATVTTRIDVSAGRSRFARQFPLVAHETTARLTWRRPNDLLLDIRGTRLATPFAGARAEVGYDRPWFVPRALGDSIRLLGIPETAALHPLAPGADAFYRYAIVDSLRVELPGRSVRAVGIRVTPARLASSMISGMLWVDVETADVVRLQAAFLGEYLWEAPDSGASARDSVQARRRTQRAQRYVTVQADLEYALLENRYWMPYRQALTLLVEMELLVRGAIPVRALTTFSDYVINADARVAFTDALDSERGDRDAGTVACGGIPSPHCDARERDALGYRRGGSWEGGRWEIAVPPRDSLAAYVWSQPLTLALSAADEDRVRRSVADLSRLAEDLPDEWVGRRTLGVDWARVGEVARFNRVQGLSLGLGLTARPGAAFTRLDGWARFGLADERLTGGLAWRRDAPAGMLEVRAQRDVREAEPWTRGTGLGNTLNAVLAGHDDADYYLGLGGAVAYRPYHGLLEDVEVTLGFERHRSMERVARSAVNDLLGGTGELPPNPSVAEGDFVRLAVAPVRRLGAAELRLGLEALVGDSAGGRGWAAVGLPFALAGRRGVLMVRTAYAVGDSLPQLFFRAGGPMTVRGYDYGTRRGRGGWAAQLDVALSRRWLLSPVVFADVGDSFDAARFDPLVGVGGGVSVLGGWIRLNGAIGLNPREDFRFDLLFRAPR